MTHRQNLASPQQGNRTIIDDMQDVKHNIDFLALMNVSVDFDELSIRVLNGLNPTYSNISHARQVRDTAVTFEELSERLLSYKAQLKTFVPSATPASSLVSAFVTSTSPSPHCRLTTRGGRNHNQAQQSWILLDTQLGHYRSAPLIQLGPSRYLGRCQICGITGHST